MPSSLDSLRGIPVIGQIAGILSALGRSSGPTREQIRTGAGSIADQIRRLQEQLAQPVALPPPTPVTLPPQPIILPPPPPPLPVPPIPSVGTTTPDTIEGSTLPTSSTSSTSSSGETDRERRRREREEARRRAQRSQNVSILGAFQTGLGIASGIAGLASNLRSRGTSPGTAAVLQQAYPGVTAGTLLPMVMSQPPATPGSGFRTGGGFGGRYGAGQFSRPPGGYHYAKDGSGKIVRNRTMNVLNLSAAKRAIRRIKGARKVLRSIESSLPKRAASSARKRR